MAEQTPEQILQSIREDNPIVFNAYVRLLNYFETNSVNLSGFDILGDTDIEITEDGAMEKRLAIAEKRAGMMKGFGDKYDYYVDLLLKYSKLLSQEQLKQVEKHLKPKSYSREDRAR